MTDAIATEAPSRSSIELLAPPEVDLYGPVHKGIRWGLAAMLTRLGTADPGAHPELERILDDLEGLLYLCERHAHHEDRALHPALEAKGAPAVRELDRDHHAQDAHIAELRALAAWLTRAAAERRSAILHALYQRFGAFVAESLAHMDREERTAQPAFDALYSREERVAIQGKLLAGIGPEERVAFYRLMLPAASRSERKLLLRRIADAAPAAVVDSLMGDLRGSLSPSDHEELRRALEHTS